jgi:hypothetical protein
MYVCFVDLGTHKFFSKTKNISTAEQVWETQCSILISAWELMRRATQDCVRRSTAKWIHNHKYSKKSILLISAT